jgi:hypothetical protein
MANIIMSKSYKIKVNSGKGEAKFVDIPQAGTTGKPLTVKAVAGGKYQLVDDSSGFAPENIRAKRVGKDLQVFFEGRATADLVVEDYYDVTAEGFNALIGEAESGRFYEYIPESAVGNTAVPALADGSKQIGMALGGAEINPAGAAVGALVATGLFNPLLLGAGAVGAAAAASGSRSGGTENAQGIDPNNKHTIDIVSMKLDTGHNLDGNNATLANGDFITKAREHQYSGTLSGFTNNGASVELILTNKTNDTVIEKTNIQPTLDSTNQKWSWTWNRSGSLLADGEYNLVANLVDKAGNLISKDTQLITVDNSQDNNSGIKDLNTDLKMNPISILDDTGKPNDFLTNDRTLTFNGSFDKDFVSNGDRLLVKIFDVKGQTISEKFVLPSGKNWTFANAANLGVTGESHNYTIKTSLVDAAGNTVKATDQSFTVDLKSPAFFALPEKSGTTRTFSNFSMTSNEHGSYTYTSDPNNEATTVTKVFTGGSLDLNDIQDKTFSPGKFKITFTDLAGNSTTQINTLETWIFNKAFTVIDTTQLPEPGFEKDQLVGSVGTQTITSADFNMASLYDGIAAVADVAAANHIQLGEGKQTLALTMGDVLELGVKNSFSNTGDHKGRLQLRIDGDAQDVIKLDNLAGSKELAWNTNNVDITVDGQAYKVFSNADLGLSLFVSNSITTINLV